MIEKPEIKFNEGFSEMDFQKVHEESFVDVDAVLKPQPVAISIGETNYKGLMYPISYGSYGDFSCIVGASKSKKTFLKSLLTSCYMGGNSDNFAKNIKGHDVSGRFIIDFDTEQSEFHAQRVFRRVIEMYGEAHSLYRPFALRKLSADERLEFIDWVLTKSQYTGKIGLVLIDGVADLVNDVNDLQASNKVAQKLLEWSTTQKCHIITVLHRNFQSKKPTGHLGSAVLKKAETVVFVEKDEEHVIVNPEYTRNQPFEPFSYFINEDWLPEVVGEYDANTDFAGKIDKDTRNSFKRN